jgi:hypothetical protein
MGKKTVIFEVPSEAIKEVDEQLRRIEHEVCVLWQIVGRLDQYCRRKRAKG